MFTCNEDKQCVTLPTSAEPGWTDKYEDAVSSVADCLQLGPCVRDAIDATSCWDSEKAFGRGAAANYDKKCSGNVYKIKTKKHIHTKIF